MLLSLGGTFRTRAQNAAPGPQAQQAPRQSAPVEAAPPEPTPSTATGSQPAALPYTVPKGKKLVLKDGTDQVVREYQRDGDRVRYYSVERSAWEEIPASLVDWDATQKAEAEQQAEQKQVAEKVKADETAARFADLNVDASLQVRPGVFLPDAVGFYVLDGQKVLSLEQDQATAHINKGREAERVISGVPFIPSKHHIEIAGKQAKLRVHALDPEFYFRTADGREPQISLLRADVKGDKRELLSVSSSVIGGDSYKDTDIALREWDAASSVYRYTLDQALPSGEYAFVETTSEGVALYVWDFGLDSPKGESAVPAVKNTSKKAK